MPRATGGFVATSSTYSRVYNPINDNATESLVFDLNGGASAYWQIELDAEIIPKTIVIKASKNPSIIAKILGSQDGTNFTEIADFVSDIDGNTYTLNGNQAMKYIKLTFENPTISSSSGAGRIKQFQITSWYTQANITDLTIDNHIETLDTNQRASIQIPSTFAGGYPRLNIHGTGAKAISLPLAFKLYANKRIPLIYDGTKFILDETTDE